MKKNDKEKEDDLSVVVLSFDGYRDVWPYFFQAFTKYWGNCKYDKYLINNKAQIEYENFKVINTGEEKNWCYRAKKGIEEVNSKYVLLLLEDYLIGSKVNNFNIIDAMNFIKDNDVRYFRITNIPHTRIKKEKNKAVYPIYENEEYGVNLQASIWNKKYLMEILDKVEGSAWDFEMYFLKEAVNGRNQPRNGCYVSIQNIIDIHNGVLKGKWFPNTIKYFSKKGILINTKERDRLSIVEVLNYNIRFNLRESLPYSTRKKIKKILVKCGVKFVTKY